MQYSLPTLETESTSLCPYVIHGTLLPVNVSSEHRLLPLILKLRRWFQRQRDSFFTITPEERKLVEESMTSRPHDESSK
jgi:hypothetical protein